MSVLSCSGLSWNVECAVELPTSVFVTDWEVGVNEKCSYLVLSCLRIQCSFFSITDWKVGVNEKCIQSSLFFKGLFKRNLSTRITFWQIKGQTDCAWIFMLCSVNTGANGERFSSWWRCDRQRWTLRQRRQNSTPQVHRRVCARAPDYHVIPVLSTKQCCCGWFVLFNFVPTCEIPIKVEVPLKKKKK